MKNNRAIPLAIAVTAVTAVTAVLVVAGTGRGLAAADVELQPHRAVYDMSLERVTSSANIAAVSGRMVFEFTGSACEGFTVNSRFVTRIDDDEGSRRVTDLRSSTFETAEADRLEFLNQTYVNETLQDEVKGSAVREAGGLKVALTAPAEKEEFIEGDPLFPTRHVIGVIEAARAGEKFYEADLYDGADDGFTVYATAAVIGAPREGVGEPERDDERTLTALSGARTHWPVTLSYFDLGGDRGEMMPKYELRFLLYDNGISRNLTLDYGTFVLAGSMVELELLETPACE